MKKAYITPTIVASGNVVRETLNGVPIKAPESQTSRLGMAGEVGYYL